jgi:hypothetical protein
VIIALVRFLDLAREEEREARLDLERPWRRRWRERER